MCVVAAGVHDRYVLTVVFATRFGSEWRSGLFKDRQAIHISPERHYRPRFSTDEGTYNACMRDSCLHIIKTQASQVLRDNAGCPELTIRKFGMFVQIVPPGDDLGLDRCKCSVQVAFRILCQDRGCGHKNQGGC